MILNHCSVESALRPQHRDGFLIRFGFWQLGADPAVTPTQASRDGRRLMPVLPLGPLHLHASLVPAWTHCIFISESTVNHLSTVIKLASVGPSPVVFTERLPTPLALPVLVPTTLKQHSVLPLPPVNSNTPPVLWASVRAQLTGLLRNRKTCSAN